MVESKIRSCSVVACLLLFQCDFWKRGRRRVFDRVLGRVLSIIGSGWL